MRSPLSCRLRRQDYLLLEDRHPTPFSPSPHFAKHTLDSSPPAESRKIVQSILSQGLLNHKILSYKKVFSNPALSPQQKNFPFLKKKYHQDLLRDPGLYQDATEYTIIDKQSYLTSQTLDLNKRILIIVANEQQSRHQRLRLGNSKIGNVSFDGLRQLKVHRLEDSSPPEGKDQLHSTAFRRKSLEHTLSCANKQVRLNNLFLHVIQQKKHLERIRLQQIQAAAKVTPKKYKHLSSKINHQVLERRKTIKFQEQKPFMRKKTVSQLQTVPSAQVKVATTPPPPPPREGKKASTPLRTVRQNKKLQQEYLSISSQRSSKLRIKGDANSIDYDIIKNVYNVSDGRYYTKLAKKLQVRLGNKNYPSHVQSTGRMLKSPPLYKNNLMQVQSSRGLGLTSQTLNTQPSEQGELPCLSNASGPQKNWKRQFRRDP